MACRGWSWDRSSRRSAASTSTSRGGSPTATRWSCSRSFSSWRGGSSSRRSACRCRRCATTVCARRASAFRCRCALSPSTPSLPPSPAPPAACWRRPPASLRSMCSISIAAPRSCSSSWSAAPATSTAASSAPSSSSCCTTWCRRGRRNTGTSGSACFWSCSCCWAATVSSGRGRGSRGDDERRREPGRDAAAHAMSLALQTRGLVKRFGGLVATNDVSLGLERGARHALIGPNGAGKTTLINLLTGVLEPTAGSIVLDGEDITSLAAHRRVGRGLVRTFQINQLFNELTPLTSLALAVSVHRGASRGWWRSLGRQRGIAEECDELLGRFRLADVMNRRVAELAYGKRRLLEIATALACRPRVLLLDEPVAGVPEGERQEIFETINALPADVSVLLIEHDMDLVFNFARTVTVLVNGAVFAEGDVQSIANDPRVKAVYLGEDEFDG